MDVLHGRIQAPSPKSGQGKEGVSGAEEASVITVALLNWFA